MQKMGVPRADQLVSLPVPPPVPTWTRELAVDRLRRFVKRCLLSTRATLFALASGRASPPDLKLCKRIVILRTDRLGDAVLTFPLVRRVKRLAPDAEVIYAVRKNWAGLFQDQDGLDRILPLPESFSGRSEGLAEMAPDLIIDPLIDPALETARLCLKSGARWRVGFAGGGREYYFSSYAKSPENPLHFTEEVFELLKLWKESSTGAIAPPFLRIPSSAAEWWEEQRSKSRLLSGSYVCIHSGGFYSTQRWPRENFIELARIIRTELDLPLVWCEDPSGREAVGGTDRIDQIGVARISTGQIERLAAVLGKALVFVGNNSGPLHLASALGVPTISVMGPTIPHRWWPIGENHRVIRLGVACSPCNLGWCSHHTCLRAIGINLVVGAIRELLSTLR